MDAHFDAKSLECTGHWCILDAYKVSIFTYTFSYRRGCIGAGVLYVTFSFAFTFVLFSRVFYSKSTGLVFRC